MYQLLSMEVRMRAKQHLMLGRPPTKDPDKLAALSLRLLPGGSHSAQPNPSGDEICLLYSIAVFMRTVNLVAC